MDGVGVERNVSYRVAMIARAAELGLETACYKIGTWHRDGSHGFPKDEALTRKWFRKMETCKLRGHVELIGIHFEDDEVREEAVEWLREHPERS